MRTRIAPALAACLATLAGCNYSAVVRNESSRTVIASVRHDRFLAPESNRGSARLEPGDEASFGPYKIDPLEPIYIQVRVEGDVFGANISERLEQGRHEFVVEDGTLESWEPVALRRAVVD